MRRFLRSRSPDGGAVRAAASSIAGIVRLSSATFVLLRIAVKESDRHRRMRSTANWQALT
ncbi:hypothetical protein GCM10010324_16030 [Streptomyces hiroshimensis]|uniref:Uncharacterized protein n=1 Tax=Streptomyces hiroshimensis TaxID=66424 RepID=A0ABQ2Y7U4_9ACTN|nr:hypothetical protein GCM10010324_16030 [Streptomyces hiroshimensis]